MELSQTGMIVSAFDLAMSKEAMVTLSAVETATPTVMRREIRKRGCGRDADWPRRSLREDGCDGICARRKWLGLCVSRGFAKRKAVNDPAFKSATAIGQANLMPHKSSLRRARVFAT